MANTGFDPLRADPFAQISSQPLVASPQSGTAHNQWSLQNQQSPQAMESQEDVLLQFSSSPPPKPPQHQPVTPDAPTSVPMRRRANSSASGTSSLGSRSAGGGPSILDDLTFAPPPDTPPNKDYTRSLFHAEEEAVPHTPPDWNLVKHSGTCMARLSLRTLLTKKWKQVFWIAYGNDQLLFFRNRFDFEDWVKNPHLSFNQREKLVKLRVNFSNPNISTRKDTENIKGFQCSPMKMKSYKTSGYMHQFKLDKWTDAGPTINGAFGSQNEDEIRELHIILRAMLKESPMYKTIGSYDGGRSGDDSSAFSAMSFRQGGSVSARSSYISGASSTSGGASRTSHVSQRSNVSQRSTHSQYSGHSQSGGERKSYWKNNIMANAAGW